MGNDAIKHLFTPAGEKLKGKPWNVYPRPLLQRDSFLCLNGAWDFAVTDSDDFPAQYPEQILVPFCPESLLSGIGRTIPKNGVLYYRTYFTLPDGFLKDRVLLHVGACDQFATIYVNGKEVTAHEGGYHPFSADITPYLQQKNELIIKAKDPLTPRLPYGKQKEKRGGMWYTPVSGIWQTVWLESVPTVFVRELTVHTGETGAVICADGVTDGTVTVTTPDGDCVFPMQNGKATVNLANPRLWCPEDPYLYHFSLQTETDTVYSYFALRALTIETVNNVPRLCLNGKPYFFHGLLDQGYFSDGIYTPASPDCFEQEILTLKKLGFNTLRKHIKIEPQLFYYACDKLGMFVFQDMVNNGNYSFIRDTALPTIGLKKLSDNRLHRNPATRRAFLTGMEETVHLLYNHPSIVYWTIFNEGWGQFDSEDAYHLLKAIDPTRFIDTASGWFKGAKSDVESEHVYFKPFKFSPSPRPVVLSEFGGYSYKPEGHVFNEGNTYGYRFFEQREAFEQALLDLYKNEVIPTVEKGLCGAILTQVSDVEDETNGLLSYDRKVIKVSEQPFREIGETLQQQIQ